MASAFASISQQANVNLLKIALSSLNFSCSANSCFAYIYVYIRVYIRFHENIKNIFIKFVSTLEKQMEF